MIVADTHSWIWWLTDREMLSARARDVLHTNPVAVSTITFLEVATLVRRGRVVLHQPLLAGCMTGSSVPKRASSK